MSPLVGELALKSISVRVGYPSLEKSENVSDLPKDHHLDEPNDGVLESKSVRKSTTILGKRYQCRRPMKGSVDSNSALAFRILPRTY